MTAHFSPNGFKPIRHDRLLQELAFDAYHSKAKPPEPALCRQCHAVYQDGRWHWSEIPSHSHEAICPACQRINNHNPAGFLSLSGDFFSRHRADILSLVHHHAYYQRQEHPLKRIIAEEDQAGSLLITTTDTHLARGMGEAIKHAYQGDLQFHYHAGDTVLRVHWQRD
jgi:hypothetical protein